MKTFTSDQLADTIAALITDNAEKLAKGATSWEWFKAKQNAFYMLTDALGIGDEVGARLVTKRLDEEVRDPGLEAELAKGAAKMTEENVEKFLGWRDEHTSDDPEHN